MVNFSVISFLLHDVARQFQGEVGLELTAGLKMDNFVGTRKVLDIVC